MSERDLDLLVIGEINPDLIVLDEDPRPVFGQAERLVRSISLTIGSSSVIMACAAAKLGLRTAVVGKVGDDDFGRYMLEAMQKHRLDVSRCLVDPQFPTGVTVVLSSPADRAMLTALGATGSLKLGEVPEDILLRARHVHVGSYFLQSAARPDLPAFLRAAHLRGQTTSLDCNWDPTDAWDGIQELLPYLDVFLPNAEEARRITRLETPQLAARELARAADRKVAPLSVVVKLGARGALAVRGAEGVEVPAAHVDVVDTTGAGDCFDAGFLYGFLAGWSLRESTQFGVSCGSLSTRAVGGTSALPTLSEARAAMGATLGTE